MTLGFCDFVFVWLYRPWYQHIVGYFTFTGQNKNKLYGDLKRFYKSTNV